MRFLLAEIGAEYLVQDAKDLVRAWVADTVMDRLRLLPRRYQSLLAQLGEMLRQRRLAEPDQILKPMKQLDGFKVLRPQPERTQLDAEGWVLAKPVPGFQLVHCTKRPLDAASGDNGPPQQVVQSVFSDGLARRAIQSIWLNGVLPPQPNAIAQPYLLHL